MGGMSGIENILPKELQFETATIELYEPLTDVLHDTITEKGDIIDPQVEFTRPARQLWRLSGCLAEILKSDDEDEVIVQGAIYRGICFGFQIVDDIRVAPIESISLEYLNELTDTEDLGVAIATEVHEYLADRPAVDRLIGQYMPEICDEAYMLSDHHAEIGAAFVLMLSERQQAETYIKHRAENINLDDF